MLNKRSILASLGALAVLAAAAFVIVVLMTRVEDRTADAQARRFVSYQLADEVRQSSDDLTRMARTYVVTRDPRFEEYFNRILAIRDGRVPRPTRYQGVYWDFFVAAGENPRPDGEPVSLEDLMRGAGFTAEEFALLDRAKDLSDDLVSLEARAMHAVKGLFPDSTGTFSIRREPDLALARDLLHGSEYHAAKAAIMAPIDEFIGQVDSRTAQEIAALSRSGSQLGVLAVIIIGLGVVLLVLSLVLLWRAAPDLRADRAEAGARVIRAQAAATLRSAWPLAMAGSVVVLGVILLASWNQARMEDQMRSDTENALTTVLLATTGSVQQWFRERRQEARVWAGHVEVIEYSRMLSASGPETPETNTARAQLQSQLDEFALGMGYAGYAVLSPSGQVLASHDPEGVPSGSRGAVREEFLAEVVSAPRYGATELPYQVPLAAGAGPEPTMMIGEAIREDDGEVVAALVLLIDPQETFTRILQRGRIGESGESYAFNRDGQLISESRFDDQLRDIGLISQSERAILNIEIRDPGENMTEGFRPTVPVSELPLTLMAEGAIASGPGSNLDGYNDYRGVPVVGAWTWDETDGIGIATEMDVAEAYRAVLRMRRSAILASVATVFLVVALIGLFLRNRLRMAEAQAKLEKVVASLQDANDELENVNSVILRWGPDGNVTFLNDFGLQLFGFSREEVIGRPILGTIVPEEESTGRSLATMIEEILTSPEKFESNENENITKEGDRVWIAWRNKPIVNEDGTLREILTIGIDITARRRAEIVLNRQSIALEAAVDGIGITDTEGVLVWINPAFSELTGYSREEVIGQSPRVLKSGVHDAAFYERMWQTIAAGRVWKGEIVNKRKDGSLYTEEMSITPVRDGEGEIVNYVAIKRDITERKAAEQRIRSVTESANDAIVSSDSDSTIVAWNRAAEEMFGWSQDEIVGQPIETIIPERYRDSHRAGMNRVTETGETNLIGGSVELFGLHREGREFAIDLSLSMWEAGSARFYTGIIRDITERKAMEAELEKARLRMENELNVGREIQMSMLPLIFPAFPRRSEFDVFALLEPAREVGGDFYDFFLIDDDHYCVCVGDVSGKGVPAALFMAVTKTLIKSRASNDFAPASILTHVNNEISRNNDASMFVTIFLAILDLNTGKLRYSNAGHNPPYIRRGDGELIRLDQRHGPVIGALEGMVFAQDSVALEPEDLLFAYTDGVTEAMDEEQNLYDERRLVKVLSSLESSSAEESVKASVADVRDFQGPAEQADDITIISTTYYGSPEGAEARVLDLVVANKFEEIARAVSSFNEFAEAEGIAAPVRRSVNLVLDELLNNVISYAFADEADHDIGVTFELSGDRLSVTISDDGSPFNPFAGSPPNTGLSIEEREIGGLGIHLVRSMMDEVSYNRRTDRNVVILVKYMDDQSDN
jgi:sigma-B regulation protein RsbU (phosphoserine phosphatase)